MIWFIGFIAIVLYRVFYAGMNSKSLFYRGPRYSFEDKGPHFDENKVFVYGFQTIGIAITWPIALPVLGVYLLGKRFQKEA